jgi:DNA-binding transcriptional regulator YdaS (Cro superfamily)
MDEHGVKHADLASACGVTRPNVGYWLSGSSRPGWRACAIIERLTGGSVTMRDWLTEEDVLAAERARR